MPRMERTIIKVLDERRKNDMRLEQYPMKDGVVDVTMPEGEMFGFLLMVTRVLGKENLEVKQEIIEDGRSKDHAPEAVEAGEGTLRTDGDTPDEEAFDRGPADEVEARTKRISSKGSKRNSAKTPVKKEETNGE